MNHFRIISFLILNFSLLPASVYATDSLRSTPEAGARSYKENYKDMAFSACIANAYKDDAAAFTDAGSSVGALREWSNYDMDIDPSAVSELIENYLSRDYTNPLVESEIKGVRFDLLKCLDMYHGPELDALARRVVINPQRSYREDNPTR